MMDEFVQKTCVTSVRFKVASDEAAAMEDAGIFARESPFLERAVEIGVASGRVISVSFPAEAPADADAEHELLDRVFAYLDGAEDDFDDVALGLTVPTDQRRVLEALREVPSGRTISGEKLASVAGLDPDDEEDASTLRQALRENPVPLFVPDHRVRDQEGATPPEVAEKLRNLED